MYSTCHLNIAPGKTNSASGGHQVKGKSEKENRIEKLISRGKDRKYTGTR